MFSGGIEVEQWLKMVKKQRAYKNFVAILIVLKYELIHSVTIPCHISDRTCILKIFSET